MNIVFLGRYNKNENLTGPEKVAKRIFNRCASENKTYFIEYFFDGKTYGLNKKLFGKEKICEVNGSEVLRLGIFPLFSLLVQIKPGIIHLITFERFALVAFLYRAFFKVKIIYTLHGLSVYENKYFVKSCPVKAFKDSFAESIFIKHSDMLVFLSLNMKRLFDKYYFRTKRRISFIKNGADIEFNMVDKVHKGGKLKLVFIADVNRKEKGFDFLIDFLEKSGNKLELHIVEKKSNEKNIFFANKNIEVYFYDKMDTAGLADFLKDKDVFISSSCYEPFGLTTVECMSAGLVPVVTSETGVSDLISDGVNGFIYNYGDSDKLNRILDYISGDNSRLVDVSLEAKKIFEKVSWEKIYSDYKLIYKLILK